MAARSLTANLKPHERIICAYDASQLGVNDKLKLSMLGQRIGMWKLGYQANTAFVPEGTVLTEAVKYLDSKNLPWFYDGKFKDIENTVTQAINNLCNRGRIPPRILTIHATMRVETIIAALKAAGNQTLIAGVTLLTDHNEEDSADIYHAHPKEVVVASATRLMKASRETGIKAGIVCSTLELPALERFDLVKITPGIRDKDAKPDDQKRTATAAEAIRLGADYEVIGRPILNASDPMAAADGFATQIASAL